ncbi:MAG: hypothetical protein DMG11_03725 [Acidobacteria bacterium]|nr:MAG: hypothetical protein DMG11_03725 [Acidobacteriota bacterium]
MSDFIVDASVVAKWLLAEADSDLARSVIATHNYLRAPDLLVSELANVLWKRTSRKEITAQEATSMIEILLRDYLDVKVRLLPARILVEQAMRIAVAERQTVYDCLYLACAVQARCRLITADDRFVRSIKSPQLKQHIASLNDPALEL